MSRGRPSRASVYARLDAALVELKHRLGGLPEPEEADFVWRDIWHLEAHHSTALEGNTLVIREVEALLDKGRAVGAKPLKEYMEVKGYGDAASWVYAQAHRAGGSSPEPVTLRELREIHRTVMEPVWQVAPHPEATDREAPGNFREHDIRPFDGGMTPPMWPLVPARMQDWLELAQHTMADLHTGTPQRPLPEAIAVVHNEFEKVHPFLDGNGRTGRLVLNLLLVRLGYPPIVVLKRQRDIYLTAMQRADDGDPGALGELLARAMLDNLNRFILPNVAGPARLVPLAALVDERFSLAALRQAAQRGRLEAFQGPDGVWRSTPKAVDAYERTKHKRRSARSRDVDE